MAASTEVKISSKPKKVVKSVAKEILKFIQKSSQPRFDIALSGGNTPKKLYKVLAEKYADSIPWDRIHFWWGDERCVPPENNDSNFKLANDYLLSNVPVPKENIHRIRGENDPEEESIRYTYEIQENLQHRGENPVFDLILLGLGEDGHTASIFPNQPELFEKDSICAVTSHPQTGLPRLTLTGKVLNNANRIFFIVTGENKSGRVSEIMNNEEAAKLLPAYYIEPENGTVIWFLDEAAASKIS